jgi:hypothetical protein
VADIAPPNQKLGKFRPEIVVEDWSARLNHAQRRCIFSRRGKIGDIS